MEPAGLFKSSVRFFSDQELCYADILTPQEVSYTTPSLLSPIRVLPSPALISMQVLARIQVAVLNFLRILTSSTPAISNLPLVRRFLGC